MNPPQIDSGVKFWGIFPHILKDLTDGLLREGGNVVAATFSYCYRLDAGGGIPTILIGRDKAVSV